MPKLGYGNKLTGGAADSLDAISASTLSNNDPTIICTTDDKFYFYKYDSVSEAAESSPSIIKPDDGTTGRHIRQTMGMFEAYVRLRQVLQTTVHGGTFTKGAFRTRLFNSEYDPQSVCLLSSSKQFFLSSGFYYAKWRAPAHGISGSTDRTLSRLRAATSAETKIMGTVSQTGTIVSQDHSFGEGWFSSPGTSCAFEIQHYATTTRGTYGFGVKSGVTSTPSVYTVVELYKVVTTG